MLINKSLQSIQYRSFESFISIFMFGFSRQVAVCARARVRASCPSLGTSVIVRVLPLLCALSDCIYGVINCVCDLSTFAQCAWHELIPVHPLVRFISLSRGWAALISLNKQLNHQWAVSTRCWRLWRTLQPAGGAVSTFQHQFKSQLTHTEPNWADVEDLLSHLFQTSLIHQLLDAELDFLVLWNKMLCVGFHYNYLFISGLQSLLVFIRGFINTVMECN